MNSNTAGLGVVIQDMSRTILIKFLILFSLALPLSLNVSCQSVPPIISTGPSLPSLAPSLSQSGDPVIKPLAANAPEGIRRALESAFEQTKVTKTYDPAYVVLDYPNGDVPLERGVCTDVVIRAMRKSGVDLQKEVHEDMKANFSLYPKKWGLTAADPNIDHRRVPNLQTFFTRRGKSLPVTEKADDYKPGDLVTWDLDGKGLTHIGIVTNLWSEKNKRYYIIHNIGDGAQAEDRIFDWKVTGHYRYF